MKLINKTSVKKVFNKQGIQCPISTLNLIEEHLTRSIHKMATNCKEGNVKRLTPELLWVALGRNYNNTKLDRG